jgi:hypothetical protein
MILDFSTPDKAAAAWSAVAAMLSAVAAIASTFATFLAWAAQLRSIRESTRPELRLVGWSRIRHGDRDRLKFEGVENIGRGYATHVEISGHQEFPHNKSSFAMPTTRVPSIEVGGTVKEPTEISLHWGDRTANDSMRVQVITRYHDTTGMIFQTTNSLLVVRDPSTQFVISPMAEGVGSPHVYTQTKPQWRYQLRHKLSRMWLVGRVFRRKDLLFGAIF